MKKISKKLKNLRRIISEKGIAGVKNKLQIKSRQRREQKKYEKWFLQNGSINQEKRREISRQIEEFKFRPLISILLPVYNVEEKWLRKCIDSVLSQIYENWELCIADDCSPAPHIRKVLEEFVSKDQRIRVIFRAENGHISAASNSALELADGEFCALLDHDDELSPDALFYVVKELNDFPDAAFIYSDEDMIDERGNHYEPKFKPDFSRELFYSVNYLTHLAVYKTEVLRKIGGFRAGVEGSQDYDLALRVTEQIPEKNIRHIPRILYHWRAIRGSVALSSEEKPYAHERAREAIRAHLERSGKSAKVVETSFNYHRVCYDLPENLPKVSLIFYAENEAVLSPKTIGNIYSETDYDNLETIFISNGNAEKLNSIVHETTGEILCFVDANLKPLTKKWLKELVGFAIQTEIGAVGAKTVNSDKITLQGGLIIGSKELVSAAHKGFSSEELGNIGRNLLAGNFSAVSISCLCVRKSLFEKVGGFDFKNLPDRFFDADFCLKMREKGLRIVFTPYAELMKIDDKKRLNFERNPTAEEIKFFTNKWRKVCERDPFYNPNLSKKDASFSVET